MVDGPVVVETDTNKNKKRVKKFVYHNRRTSKPNVFGTIPSQMQKCRKRNFYKSVNIIRQAKTILRRLGYGFSLLPHR